MLQKKATEIAPTGMFVGIVKTAHSFYPQKWIEDKMKEWAAGLHLVLESNRNGADLLAIGYKYNKRKVVCFIASKESGNTELVFLMNLNEKMIWC